MASTFMEAARQIKEGAQQLMQELTTSKESVSQLLTAAKAGESRLIDKERQARKELQEKLRAERLQQILNSDGDLAVHVGGEDETPDEPHIESAPKAEPASEAESVRKEEAVPEMKAETPQEQPAPEKAETVVTAKESETVKAEAVTEKSEPVQTVENEVHKPAKPVDNIRTAATGEARKPYEQRTPREPRTSGNTQTQTRRPENDSRPPRTTDNRAPRPQTNSAKPEGWGSNTRAVVVTGVNDKPRVNDKGGQRGYDKDKKSKNKKAQLKEVGPSATAWDDDTVQGRKKRKQMQQRRPEPVVIEKAVITTETISIKALSEKIGKPAAEIIKKLFLLGIAATINQEIDFDTCELIANEFGIALEQNIAKTYEEVLEDTANDADKEEDLVERPPVVTIMGHVDHGKTSLLDAIRKSRVTEGEAGGITQHIGAYTVTCSGRQITFIDTPGHEAFTSMRARGAQVTDVVVLVVAADDGIMPQTIEAINHAKAANVPIIVAINKIDRPNADPERVKRQLMDYSLVSEEYGGDTICVEVSAKKHINLDSLLEMILLQSDVLELKANPNRTAKGTIIEAKLDKSRGPVATVLVQNGTLKKGDPIVAGSAYGRVRALVDDKGKFITSAGPSIPVEVVGFNSVPVSGDSLIVADGEKLTRQVAQERIDRQRAEQIKITQKVSLDDLFNQMAEGELKDLNVIIKADVQGSVEAVRQALEKLSNEEVRVRCIHGAVGAITGSDIMFASASNAIVIGFNVRPDAQAKVAAERENVDVRTYRVIYSAIEDIENAMKGMFKPVYQDVELGKASVRSIFRVSGVGVIAGCMVTEGKITRSAQVRVVRDGIVLHDGKIGSLRRFKDDVKEVMDGYECGINIERFNDIIEGDVIEAYVTEEVKR